MRRPTYPTVSRRGNYLLTFGVAQAALGFSYLAPGLTPGRLLVQRILPPSVYLTLSLIAAVVAILAAFVRPRLEGTAFVLLTITAATRCIANAVSFLLIGEGVALTAAIAFGLLLRVHILVAGWPDPPPPRTEVLGLTPYEVDAMSEVLLDVIRAEVDDVRPTDDDA